APFARTPRELLEAQAAFAPQSSPLTPEPPLPLLQELPEVSQILTLAAELAHGGEIYPRHLLAALASDVRVHAFLQQELGTRQLRWIVDTVRDWSPTIAFTAEAVWSAGARAGWRAPGAALRDTVVSRDLLGD